MGEGVRKAAPHPQTLGHPAREGGRAGSTSRERKTKTRTSGRGKGNGFEPHNRKRDTGNIPDEKKHVVLFRYCFVIPVLEELG